MTQNTTGIRILRPLIVGARAGLWLMAILMVALIPALIAMAISQTGTAHAATHSTGDLSPLATTAGLTGNESEMTYEDDFDWFTVTIEDDIGYVADMRGPPPTTAP